MQDRKTEPRRLRALLLALVLFCVAGCSTSSNVSVMLFADPGKYEYSTFDQIIAAGRSAVSREQTLRQLIEKAERGAAGTVVSTMAYRGEHRTAVEEIGVIETTLRQKNCLAPATWRSSTAIQ